jgi:2-amino-4-hydroxy-6-hydroxymethyldihydropteridine diphosphokinase
MSRAVLALGANLGDRFAHLQRAVDGLAGALRAVSPVYENPPWGVRDQPDFLNAVALVDADDVDAWGWLRRGQALERAAGRRREKRWGPRTLDVDVVTVDGVTSTEPELTLPHPGAHERVSVLLPWHDVDPTAELPGHGPIARLLAGLDRSTMRRRDDLVLAPSNPGSVPWIFGGARDAQPQTGSPNRRGRKAGTVVADTTPVSESSSALPDRRLDRRGHPPRSTGHGLAPGWRRGGAR